MLVQQLVTNLSIVRTIATAHGATIRACARPGGGRTVDVTFLPLPPVLRGALAEIR